MGEAPVFLSLEIRGDRGHPHHDYATTGGHPDISDYSNGLAADRTTTARHRTTPRAAIGLLGGKRTCSTGRH
jgi:hypothetical protein